MNKIIKITTTILLVFWAAEPFFGGKNSESVLDSIIKFGITQSVGVFLLFFGMVAFYCKSLQQCLELIKPENRKLQPKSVWYMFLIPFNFVEDFFIVIDLSNSIEKEAESNPKLHSVKDYGMITGIGWSIAQLLSFIPNYIGQFAGVIGLILVVKHWLLIVKINRLLNT
jgi:hypothetical protein